MLRIFFNRIMNFLRPSIVISGLGDIMDLWRRAGARDKGIFVLVFAPMFACIGGLLFNIVRFVLFVLPSFVLGFLGWVLLITLFAWGGRYVYSRFTGDTFASGSVYNAEYYEKTYTDVKFTENK